MSKQIDYELAQYDEYMQRAQHLVESGSNAEARAFEALADLYYERAECSGESSTSRPRSRRDHPKRSCC